METNYTDILKMYVATGNCDARFKTPFVSGDFVCASDRFVLVIIPQGLVDVQNYPKNVVNIEKFLETYDCTGNTIIKVADIEKSLSDPRMVAEKVRVGEDVKCDECKGDGTVVWWYKDYDEEFDCPLCGGSGYTSQSTLRPTGNMVPDLDQPIMINGTKITYKRANVLYQTCKILGVTHITQIYRDGFTNIYAVGDVKVCMMSIYDDNK